MIETNTNEVQNERGVIQPLLPTVPCNVVYHEDCISGLKRFPDNFFDLAVVDPVFGEQVTQGGYMQNSSSKMAKNKQYDNTLWKQAKTPKEFFIELFRVTKNQIIWGGNYFVEEININSSCWIVWDKDNGENHFADCELAWTSFNTAVRKHKWKWQGMLQQNMKNKEERIHPTQKPVGLYDWIFKEYAKPKDLILDTHLGSGSSRISAFKAGLSFVGFEIADNYYNDQEKRFKTFTSQLRMF